MAIPLGRRAPSWSSDRDGSLAELGALHDVAAVRERCSMVHRWVADGRSPHFTLDETRLAAVASYVADVTRDAYPDLKIPYHSRWRHFSAGDGGEAAFIEREMRRASVGHPAVDHVAALAHRGHMVKRTELRERAVPVGGP